MKRRIIIMLLSFTAIAVAMTLYALRQEDYTPQQQTDSQGSNDLRLPDNEETQVDPFKINEQTQLVDIEGTHFQSRDLQGNLTQEFGFAKRLSQTDNRLLFSKPWVKLYNSDSDQVIHIQAERLSDFDGYQQRSA